MELKLLSASEKAKISKISGILLLLFAIAVLFSQSFMDLFASLLCFYLLWHWLKAKYQKIDFKPVWALGFDWLWVLWFGIAALGFVLNTPPPPETPKSFWLSRLLEFRWILILYFTAGAFRLAAFSERALHWFNGAALLFSGIALGEYLWSSLTGTSSTPRLGGFFRFAMTHAHVYGIVFCFLSGFFFKYMSSLHPKARLFYLASLGTIGTTILLTYTRGAWIALFVSVLFMSFFWRLRNGLLTLIISLVLVFGLYSLVPSIRQRIEFTTRIATPEAFKTSYDQERLILWKTNWLIFKDHPWVGAGLGQNKFLLRSYYDKQGIPEKQFISHAHNQYLQLLAGSGTLGLLCYLGVLGIFLFLTLKALQKTPKNEAFLQGVTLGSLGGQVFFIVGGLTESNFEHFKIKYAMILIWAIGLWAWHKQSGFFVSNRKNSKPERGSLNADSSSTRTPLISIVTPAFNSERFLAKTIESVLSQSYSHWEMHIVIDVKSTDRSLKIAQSFALQDSRIHVHSDHHCSGVSANRNLAINRSEGEFLAFLDADDCWLPLKLEKQVEFMLTNTCPISFHSYYTMNEDGTRLGGFRKAKKDVQFEDLLKNNSIGCLTVLLRRDFLQSRRFQSLRHEDLFLWLELLKGGATASAIPEPLAEYRISAHSLSKNKFISAIWRWQVYRKMKISIVHSCYYMIWYLLTALNKRF